MRPDPPAKAPVSPREASNPPSPAASAASIAPAAPAAPTVRPKLNLQKRTVQEVDPNAPATDTKASPFAGARPIDTSAREREVEERHQLAIRQKKEAEEKAKAEKAEKQKLAKEQAKEQAKESSKPSGASANGNKDDVEPAQGAKNFEILRRAGEEENGMAADVDADVDDPAAKTTAAGKASAPAGPGANQQGGKQNGNWRGAGTQSSQQAEPAADDEDGWSTVASKQRNNRRGGRGQAS